MKTLIVEYLRLKAAEIGGVDEHLGLTEKREGGDVSAPYLYVGGGDVRPVNIDSGSLGWFRTYQKEEFVTVDGMRAAKDIQGTFYLRYAAILHRDTRNHNEYAEDIANTFTGISSDLKQILKATKVDISRSSIETDITRAWREEFTTPVTDLNYRLGMVLVDVTVNVTGSRDCWQGCSELADILQGFDWCNPATFARLTPAQQQCVADQIPCDDATWTLINTALPPDTLDSGSIPSGDSDTIIAPPVTVLRDGQPYALTPSGETVDVPSAVIPCADGNIEINGTSVGVVASGGTRDIPVIQDGSPAGSWNGTQWVIPSCPPPSQDWTRPTDWPAIPELTSSDERLVGVLAVFEHGYNVTTVAINNLAANINWGDGTSVVSNGATQTHVYDYASIAATVYQFPDGRNVKYVLVDITRVGGAITSVIFWNTSAINAQGGNNYLDIIASFPSLTSLLFSLSPSSGQKSMNLCQRIRVKAVGSGGTWSNCIRDTRSLRVLEWPYSSGGSFSNFLNSSGPIDDSGDIDYGSSTAIAGVLVSSMIRKHGDLTANSVTTTFVSYANGCFLLTEFGNITLNSATSMNSSLFGCVILSKVGLITAPSCQSLDSFALGCFSLPELIFSDCSAVTVTTGMVFRCVSLVNLVMPNLTRGVNLSTTAMGNYGVGNFANSLGTASGAQTVTVTGTPFGALLTAADATAVAIAAVITGKGYTIAN
jgi:hypothetical protein